MICAIVNKYQEVMRNAKGEVRGKGLRKERDTKEKHLMIWMCLLGGFILFLGAIIADAGWYQQKQRDTIQSSKVQIYAEPIIHNP